MMRQKGFISGVFSTKQKILEFFFLVLVQKDIFALVLVILESSIRSWILLTNSSPSLMSVSFEYL